MVQCSSGYDRIIVRPNGNIERCYSRPDPICNIYNFDSLKHLMIRECSQFGCGVCDKSNSIINQQIEFVRSKRRKLNIQLVVTEQCFHFCPYCTHSDRAKEYNKPVKTIPMSNFTSFLEKVDNCSVTIIGGEPTLRDDISDLFKIKKHYFMMFSACLYPNRINEIIQSSNEFERRIGLIPTLHPYARDFNWDRFWENISNVKKNSKYIDILKLHLLNYKVEEIKKNVIEKCKSLDIKFTLKDVDYSVSSERIDKEYIKSKKLEIRSKENKFNKL